MRKRSRESGERDRQTIERELEEFWKKIIGIAAEKKRFGRKREFKEKF